MNCKTNCKKYFTKGANACVKCPKRCANIEDQDKEDEEEPEEDDPEEEEEDEDEDEEKGTEKECIEDEFGNTGSQVYDVNIVRTSTLEKTVQIAADSFDEAEESAKVAVMCMGNEEFEEIDCTDECTAAR